MNKTEILNKIRQAGVIGAGGAGFPTYKKLDAEVEFIIANGAECEPLLYKDREAMLNEQDALFKGLKIMQELTGAGNVTIAVKQKNADITDRFAAMAKEYGFNLFIYPDVYPAGDEYLLVYEISGRQIPVGGIPLDVGCVVNNTETIINIAHALDGLPVINKYVTITGEVEQAITTVVPVGTSFIDCINLAGGLTTDDPVVLTGGVMMGGVEHDLQTPVTKTNGGIIVLSANHYLVRHKTASRESYTRIGHGQCDQCSMCTELCPRYLLGYPVQPHLVMRNLQMTGEAKERASKWAQYCVECNICTIVACPESLDPMNICADAKQLLGEKRFSASDDAELHLREIHPARKGREVPISTVYRKLGIAPYDRRAPFKQNDFIPERVIVPLNIHIGQPAEPLVKVGDTVKRGDIIGDVNEKNLGCPAHASIDGRVTFIDAKGVHIER